MVEEAKDCALSLNAYQDASMAVEHFGKGKRLIGLTRGKFSLIDLIRVLLDKTGKAHIVVATWSAGIKDFRTVKWLMDTDKVSSFRFLTDMSFENRKKSYALALDELFGYTNVRTTKLHAKFVLIGNAEWNVCIQCSMNLNRNVTCENYDIDDNKKVYDFYMNFVNGLWDKMPEGFTQNFAITSTVLKELMNEKDKKKAKLAPQRKLLRKDKANDTSWRRNIR